MPATLTADQLALRDYLEAQAEKTRQWVAEDPANRWACSAVSDPLHWAEYGIFSVDEFIKYEAVNLAYELHKDRYGFKPNYAELKAMTLEELDAYTARLSAIPVQEEVSSDPFIW